MHPAIRTGVIRRAWVIAARHYASLQTRQFKNADLKHQTYQTAFQRAPMGLEEGMTNSRAKISNPSHPQTMDMQPS